LDQLPELSEIDTVLIENQPSFKNPKMKAIADTLYAYYLIRCAVDKKLFAFEDIHLIAPNQKLKLSPIPEMAGEEAPKEEVKKVRKSKKVEETSKLDGVDSKVESKPVEVDSKSEPKKMSYKQGKEFAVKKCLSLIDAQHKTFLSTHKKKDDLCDCYLQAYHYLTKVKKIVIV
jgi:hypothetical protein